MVGTENDVFYSGHTDLRGLFEAGEVRGTATVLAKAGEGQYAFYRGGQRLGPPPVDAAQQAAENEKPQVKGKSQLDRSDYLINIEQSNDVLQKENVGNWDALRRGDNRGVEVKKAY